MTRAQYIALCIIGGIALVAYMNTRNIAAALAKNAPGGPSPAAAII